MPASLRTFALLVRAGFRQQTTYRLALAAGITTNSVFGVIRASIALAALAGTTSGVIGGYDAQTAASFIWWSQALLGTINLWGFSFVADRVRSGDIVIDYLRPLDPMLAYLAGDLGRAAVGFLARALPTVTIGALLFDLTPPPGIDAAVLGLVSIVLAVSVAFLGGYTVNLTALWLTEIRGVRLLWMVIGGLLSGLYLPLPWFPGWLQTIAAWSPFPSMLQHPVDILSGRAQGQDALVAVATQLLWVALMVALARLVTARGRRRLEVQGG